MTGPVRGSITPVCARRRIGGSTTGGVSRSVATAVDRDVGGPVESAQLAVAAAHESFEDARFHPNGDGNDVDVLVGSALGGVAYADEQHDGQGKGFHALRSCEIRPAQAYRQIAVRKLGIKSYAGENPPYGAGIEGIQPGVGDVGSTGYASGLPPSVPVEEEIR